MSNAQKAMNFVKDLGAIDAKGESDTLKLWENYREQANLWRIIAVLQFISTPALIIFCFYLYSTRSVTLNVPPKPLPGYYAVNQIPESEFVSQAEEIVNLIASYQPANARGQFAEASKMLMEPAYSTFLDKMIGTELKTIESTSRTQLFFVDPTKTKTTMAGREIQVSLEGERLKLIAGKQLAPVQTRFLVTMTTVPRQSLNPYGIMVTGIDTENVRQG
ncbi:MAG: hypothetical protein KDD64_09260 [Bdellovibrionales bacterium]|nr:hypothetical protein [Bdellovibrionales bacterium]